MQNIIIALLFRVTISNKTVLEKIEYILFVVEALLANPDFQDAAVQTLLGNLKTAALAAQTAVQKAESHATADVNDKNKKVKTMDKLYKKVVIKAEEICDDDGDKADATGLQRRKKRSKKNAEQPQRFTMDPGKQEGDIICKCKSLGSGIMYAFQIRKEGEKYTDKYEVSKKASFTFSGLESGAKYEGRVFAKVGEDVSKPSDIASCRAA